MDSSEQAEGAETALQSRPKRSRTGCLTCRTRRRKCDEGRPKCQNCISKSLECRYAAAFQILGKNNFTPEVSSSVRYTSLKFVSDSAKDEEEQAVDEANEGAQLEHSPSAFAESSNQPLPLKEKEQHDGVIQEATSPSIERYEFALHGLLALGSHSAGVVETQVDFATLPVNKDTTPNQSPESSLSNVQSIPAVYDVYEFPQTDKVQNWPLIHANDITEEFVVSDDHILDLLRHYRYGIAPWLDICDMNQFFGLEVLQLSTTSNPLRYAVLALAEMLPNARDISQNSNVAILAHLHRQGTEQNKMYSALLDTLGIIRSAIVDLSGFWTQDSTSHEQNILEALLLDASNSHIASSAFWLITRLQLSVALTNTMPLRIPLPASLDTAWTYIANMGAGQVFRCAHETVALCIDATIFSRGDEDRWLQQRYGLNRVDLWKTLVAGLEQWYKHRPQDFQPVIELYPRDGKRSEDEFPTIVFSSGAATLANQLYHTGMVLLLQHKPRFVNRTHSSSSSMSLLWHVHRICGIAVNNDRWDCWDPSLLASLLVAAKIATHQSQHSVILNTLENVQQLTGFKIALHIEELKHEWQQAEHW